jgi:hypothetical protein
MSRLPSRDVLRAARMHPNKYLLAVALATDVIENIGLGLTA